MRVQYKSTFEFFADLVLVNALRTLKMSLWDNNLRKVLLKILYFHYIIDINLALPKSVVFITGLQHQQTEILPKYQIKLSLKKSLTLLLQNILIPNQRRYFYFSSRVLFRPTINAIRAQEVKIVCREYRAVCLNKLEHCE